MKEIQEKPIHLQWRRNDVKGTEQASIRRIEAGYLFDGTVEYAMDNRPVTAHYQINANTGWETKSVQVEVKAGSDKHLLRLSVDELQRWWDGDDEIGVLAGCLDVDLQISPITNSLVIRREEMPVGESRLVTAAWIQFPDLELQPVRQRYTRTGENRYQFADLESGYTAELEVDRVGFVTRYNEIWIRV